MNSTAPRTDAWQEAIEQLPQNMRAELDGIWDNRGVLSGEAVGRLVGDSQSELRLLMMQILPLARLYAVVPVSHYPVGAVAAGMPVPGTNRCSLYLGANFELADAALSCTVHAEQAAANNAWLNGEHGLQALAISAAPCGYCRQFLQELVTAKNLAILLPDDPQNTGSGFNARPLSALLPEAFGPGDLGVAGGLMDPQVGLHKLALDSGPPADPTLAAALEAAAASYAPYPTDRSYNYAGVALERDDGRIFAGRYAENAAYNPSLSPLQSALAFMNMAQPQAGRVVRCLLVEVPTLGSQRRSTESALPAVAPGIGLEYHKAHTV